MAVLLPLLHALEILKKNLMRGSDSFASQLLFFPADESKYKWIRNDFSCEQMGFFHEI